MYNGRFKPYSVIICLRFFMAFAIAPLCVGFKPGVIIDFIVLFQNWQNADLNGKFKLPMKNEFIPTNFEIYPLEKDSPSYPTLIKVCCFFSSILYPAFQNLFICITDGFKLFTSI